MSLLIAFNGIDSRDDAVGLLLGHATIRSSVTRIRSCRLGRIALFDNGSEGIAHNQDSEALHILEAIAAGLCVVKLSANICVAILEEEWC